MANGIISRNGVFIRLTDERWAHVMEGHGELSSMRGQVLATVEDPERVFVGGAGERLATREVEPGKWLVVVYRESDDDGFIITAFLTRRFRVIERREQRWP